MQGSVKHRVVHIESACKCTIVLIKTKCCNVIVMCCVIFHFHETLWAGACPDFFDKGGTSGGLIYAGGYDVCVGVNTHI